MAQFVMWCCCSELVSFKSSARAQYSSVYRLVLYVTQFVLLAVLTKQSKRKSVNVDQQINVLIPAGSEALPQQGRQAAGCLQQRHPVLH
jgi:hypothetical protein